MPVREPAESEVVDGERTPRVKISFYGHFGTLNTGNESTLVAILARLRAIYRDGDFLRICTGPRAVRRETASMRFRLARGRFASGTASNRFIVVWQC